MCQTISTHPHARHTTPYRFDMVGSFLRPEALKEARRRHEAGELGAEELRTIEDREILALVAKQKQVGLKAVTDGEFRRSWWHLDFMWHLDGVEKAAVPQGYLFEGVETRAETARLTGRISFGSHPFIEDFRFLLAAAGTDAVARQTIPAPAQLLAELLRPENKAGTDAVYASIHDLAADVSRAYRDAILAFYDAGCRSIQLDDCTWGMLCDPKFRDGLKAAGADPDDLAKLYAQVNGAAIADLPGDLAVTTHVCRGNYASTWAGAGGYEPVAEQLAAIGSLDGYYLEFDTDRAGGFEPLRHIGEGQIVLGLFSSKNGELEDKEAILERIREAGQYVDINRICLSPQCGFASTEEGNILTEEQQWSKLALIKEIADEIWK
ncbi:MULTISPECIES: 5-methyltetrahydropteroyltriglutamate--homocysteine S-methyltransferase [Paenibacillus]|uniref:5-methyltetrahydropteroyltriglutamate-- homocysteine S-methyltransferase n=1 Tax=Paenibacillus TaxID=44249 RepID=UPI0006766D1A|nr:MULTISPECIES: 5-methyltetrahydropteroyltriglutamate--homocysteine S-methyltransferase [Paenibacillus]